VLIFTLELIELGWYVLCIYSVDLEWETFFCKL